MAFLLFIFSLLLAPPVQAETKDFDITEQINYQIDLQGNAQVEHQIKITNNFSQIYAKEYQLTLSNTNIANIKATDSAGSIIKDITQQNDQTTIYLVLNDPAVGKNQSTQFFLSYTLPQLAEKKGSTWEIALPQYQNSISQTTLSVKVPVSFGNLSFSSLPQYQLNTLNQFHTIGFSLSTSAPKILLIFGDSQLFDFTLNYFLENPTDRPVETEIALPPDTPQQVLVYQQIDPPPFNINIDTDGNWLAQYQLQPRQNLSITTSGQVKITNSSPPSQSIDTSSLTQPQQYWPVNDPQIKSISANLNTVRDIYNYVVNQLDYSYQRINQAHRLGALETLKTPQNSLCTEFTDLFITLARSQGIPAREVEGFAYTNNPKIKPINLNADILHAWPQYYDSQQQTWISIDPTWQKTTNGIDYFNELDLNHFAFVFHGHDSIYPPPPGSYKSNQNQKTVSVDFATNQLTPTYNPPEISLKNNKLIVHNPNLNALSQISLQSTTWHRQIDTLPPLSWRQIDLPQSNLIASLLPQNQKISFNLTYYQQDQPQNIVLKRPDATLNYLIAITITIFILSTGGIILTVSRPKHDQKNN